MRCVCIFSIWSYKHADYFLVHRVETMSLRLEDVNTKESSLRLSIQTIDYRLGRLEEIAANTNEALTLLHSLILRQSTPPPSSGMPVVTISRHSSNTASPLAHSLSRDDLSDIDGDNQYQDPSLGPSLLSLRTDSLGTAGPTEEVFMKHVSVYVAEWREGGGGGYQRSFGGIYFTLHVL